MGCRKWGPCRKTVDAETVLSDWKRGRVISRNPSIGEERIASKAVNRKEWFIRKKISCNALEHGIRKYGYSMEPRNTNLRIADVNRKINFAGIHDLFYACSEELHEIKLYSWPRISILLGFTIFFMPIWKNCMK